METKTCSVCKETVPIEMFNIEKRNKDGHTNRCRKCTLEYNRNYSKINKEKLADYKKEYYENNKEKSTIYREKNKDRISKQRSQHYIKNKNRILKYNNEYNALNRENKENTMKYYERNKINSKKWSINNKERDLANHRVQSQRRRSKKLLLPWTLTIIQWKSIQKSFNNKCAYCGKELPLVQEHFIALSKGGEYTSNNIIPSCHSCNSSKNNKDFFEWYPEYKDYTKKREKFILDYLHYKNNIQQLTLNI